MTTVKISVVFFLHATVRACSHEPGTVNYPGVMIAPGQGLPRVHLLPHSNSNYRTFSRNIHFEVKYLENGLADYSDTYIIL